MRSKTKTKMSVSKLDKGNGELTKTDQETADVLNNYFANVFETEDDQNIPTINEQAYTHELTNIEITNNMIEKAIAHINSSKSQGPDLIHPKVIKETKAALVDPLTSIFNKSLNEGAIPEIWKCANVTEFLTRGPLVL